MERDVIGCRSHIAYVKQIICNTWRLKAIQSNNISNSNAAITRHISGANGRKTTTTATTTVGKKINFYESVECVLYKSSNRFVILSKDKTMHIHCTYKATASGEKNRNQFIKHKQSKHIDNIAVPICLFIARVCLSVCVSSLFRFNLAFGLFFLPLNNIWAAFQWAAIVTERSEKKKMLHAR